MHLTTDSLQRLLAGTADPAEARALSRHLDGECPRCDALLAGAESAPLESMADHALTALAPESAQEAGNDLEYARIQRALRAQPQPRRGWSPVRGIAIAAAALIVAAVGVQLTAHRGRDDGWDGVKGIKGVASGQAQRVPVRLSAVAVAAIPRGDAHLSRVASGDQISRESGLQLRIELGAPADVALARLGADGSVEIFWHERAASAGPVPVTVAGQPAVYPLAPLSGPQRFVVVASAAGLTPERIEAAVRSLARPERDQDSSNLDGISSDVISMTVR